MRGLHKFKWGLLPLAAYLLVALACGAGSGTSGGECYGTSCQPSDPAKIAQVAHVQDALLGTWLIEAEITGRDAVDRPLPAGGLTWELEIFRVEPNGNTMDYSGYSWTGALKAVDMCLVSSEHFNSAGGACDEFSAVELGRCDGHQCTRYQEREVTGYYDALTEEFELEQTDADLYYLDPLTGYLNLDHTLDFTIYLGQSREPTECSSWCSWRSSPAGLYVDAYPRLDSDEIVRTFTPMGGPVRPADSVVQEEPETITIGSQTAVEEILTGDWSVRLQFESRDAVDRRVTVGHANYTLEIFAVEPAGLVGEWRWQGALRGENLCLVSDAEAQAATYRCDVFGPGIIGSCGGAECTQRDESPIEGTFNHLDGAFHMDYANAGIYYLNGLQGWIAYATYIFVQTAPLVAQTVQSTPFESWGDWSVATSGAFADTHSGGWAASEKYFEMSR